MQRIFVYEYFTGGGTFGEAASDDAVPPLAGEGAAMADGLACDFQAIPGTDVMRLRDARLPPWPRAAGRAIVVHSAAEEREAFVELAAGCTRSVVIAPEQHDALLTRTRWAEAWGAPLLCPDSRFLAIACDKNRTAERLQQHGVAVPAGRAFQPGAPLPVDFRYPAVLKPADGAGSLGVQRIDGASAGYEPRSLGPAARLETYCPGVAASVAVLCGPGVLQALPPCLQRLSADGRFRYLGGATPLAAELAERAQRLALAALSCLPAARGYVGVDLVLGRAEDGREDVVIEVNPRLTSSYIGLRQLLHTNLAAAMIAAAAGRPVELHFARQRVEFTAEGRIL